MSNFFEHVSEKFEAFGNAVKVQTGSSTSGSASGGGSRCTNCRTQFPRLFPNKQRCAVCRYFFCRACVAQVPVNGRVQLGSSLPLREAVNTSVAPACPRCRVLSDPNFTYDQLMGLRPRDLLWFLQRTRTDCPGGLKEKEQLADLVMERFGSEDYRRQRDASGQRAARLASNLGDLGAAAPAGQQPPQRQAAAPEANDADPVADVDDPELDTVMDPEVGVEPEEVTESDDDAEPAVNVQVPAIVVAEEPSVPPPPYPGLPNAEEPAGLECDETYNAATAAEVPTETAASASAASAAAAAASASAPASASASAAASAPSSAPASASATPSHRLDVVTSVDQIISEADLDLLSVRQMKVLLAKNFVDFRGCLEREELLERLRRLYRERTVARDAVERDALPDEDLCKICMDAVIDCVLLECGHMVTCVTCGKQCADCPVCRQYVVRVVRTFKS